MDRPAGAEPRSYLLRHDLPQDAVAVARDALGEFSALLAATAASWLEEVGQVEHPPHVVPAGVAEAVVAHSIQHAPVGLTILRGAIGRGAAVRRSARPRRISQRVVEPHGLEPPAALLRRHLHLVGPFLHQRRDPPNVGAASLARARPPRYLFCSELGP